MSNNQYFLREDVRIFFNSEEEIRLRKGIWNYVEAVINLNGQSDSVRNIFQSIIQQLKENSECSLEKLSDELKLDAKEQEEAKQVLENIKQQGFFISQEEKETNRIFASLFGSPVQDLQGTGEELLPALFISDNDLSNEAAKKVSEEIKLPLEFLEKGVFDQLSSEDLTSFTDALEALQKIEKFQSHFEKYSCIVVNLSVLNISLLRNINRVALKLEKPLIVSYIDGPFIGAFSLYAPKTGCFECLENRLIARMEDLTVYQKFIDQIKGPAKVNQTHMLAPYIYMLSSLMMSEAFLYASNGISRLMGRIINIYLPAFEIQIQDLLRVPYCSACGFNASANMQELYTSSKNVIDRMLERVEVKK